MTTTPTPIDDLHKGFSLLLRAAKTALERLPTEKVGEAVLTGVREVQRAVGNMASTLERDVSKRSEKPAAPPAAAEPTAPAETPPPEGDKPAS